jgi:hypothetical protein
MMGVLQMLYFHISNIPKFGYLANYTCGLLPLEQHPKIEKIKIKIGLIRTFSSIKL